MSQIIPCTCEQLSGAKINCIIDEGEPWFKAIDVASTLKHRCTDEAVRRHVAADDKRKQKSSNLDSKTTRLQGNWRNVIYINKFGIRALVAKSQTIEAVAIAQKFGITVETKHLRK